ncbi:hypothetical protein FAGKG844_260044 [Frankia sp. AgKG'84/4]
MRAFTYIVLAFIVPGAGTQRLRALADAGFDNLSAARVEPLGWATLSSLRASGRSTACVASDPTKVAGSPGPVPRPPSAAHGPVT